MKISYINLSTLILFFTPLIIKKNSFIAKIVLWNGLLFHTHIDNKILFWNDLLTNILLILYANYYHTHIRKYSLIGCSITLINFYNARHNPYSKYFHALFHSFFTHGIGAYCLYITNDDDTLEDNT